MGYDKYGLDWSVWGGEPEKPKEEEPAPLKTLHDKKSRTDQAKKKPVVEEIDLSELGTIITPPPKKPLTCTLKNARFLPDDNTDFNETCKIVVDVEGKPAGPISFALWAKYKGTEYDLQHEKTAFENDGKAQVELKLFYVDEYYNDVNSNGVKDASVEYFAKVSNKAAREIKSEMLKMPPQKELFTLSIEHLYHDNAPVCKAPFEIECANGSKVNGNLDENGTAEIKDMASKPFRILFHPDIREYAPVNLQDNPAYLASFSQADADTIVAEAGSTEIPPEKKSIVLDSVKWVCGTLQGSFNDKQTISQIIVDAVIGIIPVVGDVTAVRDIIAVIIGLSLDEKKRNDKLQWISLVLLIFALIPVLGGVIKGIGKLLLKLAKSAADINEFIAALNRLGAGDAVKFVKELDLTKYTADTIGKFRELTQRLDTVITSTKGRFGKIIPADWIARLDTIQQGLKKVSAIAEKMIPDAIKELQERLKIIQDQIYKGEWHDIPKTMKSSTREIEARIVESVVDGKSVKKWTVDKMDYPPNTKNNFVPCKEWPDLSSPFYFRNGKFEAIEAFSGPITAVKLPPGTKIRRVIQANSNPTGLWWSYELPQDGKAWREEFAVLENWSKNGIYIEYTVDAPGLYVWEGKVASQIDASVGEKASGQYLKGGATQLLVDFSHPANSKFADKVRNLPKKPTNWGDSHLDINIPEKDVITQILPMEEIASKGNVHLATTSRGLQATTGETKNK